MPNPMTQGATTTMPTPPKSTDLLTATVSFRLSESEWKMLNIRADHEHRTVSNLCRMLLRIAPSHPRQE